MEQSKDTRSAVAGFLAQWSEGEVMRQRFSQLYSYLQDLSGVSLDFVARPGVSYSLRPQHQHQKERQLFAMVDVIDDESRWLSVCFYGDMITDPEERGELIPGGLAGDDGYCFDMFDDDQQMVDYLLARLAEASKSAAGS